MKVLDGKGVIIKTWCQELEEEAYNQACNLSALPFVQHHVALMPDCHTGYGMPIGGVIACEGVIIPNAVGVDIGCGMVALKSKSIKSLTNQQIKDIMGIIREEIPVGFNHHKESHEDKMPEWDPDSKCASFYNVIPKEYKSACKQVGTLGGGNHFIELQQGDDGYIWAMVHSGSRNLGFKVAKYYNDLAKKLNAKWFSSVDPKWDLAFFPMNTMEAVSYKAEMEYCLKFAEASRRMMIDKVSGAIYKVVGEELFDRLINIHHNYAIMEHHFGKNVMVHRKGATSAKEGQIGIIPGSQGTSSYIVRGKGNEESFMSCSHGAGRTMGRKQAQRTLDLDTEIKKLEDQGIVHSIRTVKDLDEASGAYKDIDVVMEAQKDLVDIEVKLTPLGVVKG